MSLTVSDKGGGDFVLVPEGTHIARCVRVIDLGLQPGSTEFPEAKNKVLIAWEVPGETITIDDEERPALLMSRYTASLHKKAKLRADLESWRGRGFTEEELKAFSLKNVLNATCLITVVHSPDGKYANVRSVAKMPKGFACPDRVNDLVYYEIEDGVNDVYTSLSEKLRAAIDIGRAQHTPQPKSTPAPATAHDDTRQRGGQLKATTEAAKAVSVPQAETGSFDEQPFF